MHPLTLALLILVSGGLAFANLHTVEQPIVTADDGVWPGSWKRLYGWPRTAYGTFGYHPGTGGVTWRDNEGLTIDLLAAAGLLGLVVLACELAMGLATRRPVIRNS